MLIKFESKRAASFVMQASVAEQLIAMMGQRGKLEHSISGEDVVDALRALDRALSNQLSLEDEQGGDEEEREQEHVSLDARATPLREMLQHAKQIDSYVMWHPD